MRRAHQEAILTGLISISDNHPPHENVSDAIGYVEHRSRSHGAVIRVYDDAGNVIQTHEQAGEFREW